MAGTHTRARAIATGAVAVLILLSLPLPSALAAPDTTITGGPSGTVTSSDATFMFTSDNRAATFECARDGESFTSCTSPKSYTGLGDGAHSFQVRAIDGAGAPDPTPASRTWVVDRTPPDTTITSGPSGTVASSSATFEFTATEAATFECALDGASFGPCSSPQAYNGLADGGHTFTVRARDTAGNIDPTPATRSWTVATTSPTPSPTPSGSVSPSPTPPSPSPSTAPPPSVVPTPTPDAPGDTEPPDTVITTGPYGETRDPAPAFTLMSSEPGSTFMCAIDGEEIAPCSSPHQLPTLPLGPHWFYGAAVDPSGNMDPSPDERRFVVVTGESTDRCPGVPRGSRTIALGCTALELIVRPELIIGPALEGLTQARAALGNEAFQEAAPPLRIAVKLVGDTGHHVARGNPCKGERTAAMLADKLTEAGDAVDAAIAEKEAAAARARSAGGDVDVAEIEIAFAKLDGAVAMEHIQPALDAAGLVGRLCDALGKKLVLRGRVVSTDDSASTLELKDGSVVARPEGKFPVIVEGRTVLVKGRRIGKGEVLATSVQDRAGPANSFKATIKCMRLRIAPVQALPPYHGGPYTLHHPKGYQNQASVAWLEEVMRLGAVDSSCKGATPDGKAIHYSMKIDIEQAGQTWTVATDLEDGEGPVGFPWGLKRFDPFDISYKVYRTTCKILGDFDICGAPEQLSDQTLPARLYPYGHFAVADYEDLAFSVRDDGELGDFNRAEVSGFTESVLGFSPSDLDFKAEGYSVINSVSSKPQIAEIEQGDGFAIYDDDFSDDPDDDDYFSWTTSRVAQTGQDDDSGLRWAHIEGVRNNKPFWYAAQLPPIVRDKVADCLDEPAVTVPAGGPKPTPTPTPTSPPGNYAPINGDYNVPAVGDSFYKLPFEKDFSPGLGLLNIDDPNPPKRHPEWQAFALDLIGASNTPILAARGGEVGFIEESDTWNFNDEGFPPYEGYPGIGNYMFIRHEDGTYAVYFHMEADEVWPNSGDDVDRGDAISEIGSTGNSSTPHVHFGVASTETHNVTADVVRIQYEAKVNGSNQQDPCYIPRSTDTVKSTNQ